jgi:hypothetical protein
MVKRLSSTEQLRSSVCRYGTYVGTNVNYVRVSKKGSISQSSNSETTEWLTICVGTPLQWKQTKSKSEIQHAHTRAKSLPQPRNANR